MERRQETYTKQSLDYISQILPLILYNVPAPQKWIKNISLPVIFKQKYNKFRADKQNIANYCLNLKIEKSFDAFNSK